MRVISTAIVKMSGLPLTHSCLVSDIGQDSEMNRLSRVVVAAMLAAGVMLPGAGTSAVVEARQVPSSVQVCLNSSSGVVSRVSLNSVCMGGTQNWSASNPAPLLCWDASSLSRLNRSRLVSAAPIAGCVAPLSPVPVGQVSLLCADRVSGVLRWPITGTCRFGNQDVFVRPASAPTTMSATPTTSVLVPSVSLSATLIDGGTSPKAAVVTTNVAGTVYFIEGASPVNTVSDITSAPIFRWSSGVVAANTPTSIALDVEVLTNGYYRVFLVDSQGVLSAPALNKVTISIPRISNVVVATTTAPLSCAAGGVCDYGDTGPGGGVVFYVASSNFTSTGSTCNTACKYMEAAATDQSTGIVWATTAPKCWNTAAPTGDGSNNNSCQSFSIYSPHATPNQAASRTAATAIGKGMANTNAIYDRFNSAGAAVATNTYAAGVAYAYANNGKTDWHLPSKAELNELYNKRTTVGGFSSAFYWSSSEDAPTLAWTVGFDGTSYYSYAKTGTEVRVRPVRAF